MKRAVQYFLGMNKKFQIIKKKVIKILGINKNVFWCHFTTFQWKKGKFTDNIISISPVLFKLGKIIACWGETVCCPEILCIMCI